ncbi:hypothetical protein E0H62_33705 [Rhizobium leguminosarum bv. viciae]|nr:hypothetical protein E0H62_33705 [Rhizobium leguminosarum bv. viciae]
MKDFIEIISKYISTYLMTFVHVLSRLHEFAKNLPGSEEKVYADAITFFSISIVCVQFIRAPLFDINHKLFSTISIEISQQIIFFIIEAGFLSVIFKILSVRSSVLSTFVLSSYLFSVANIIFNIGVLLAFLSSKRGCFGDLTNIEQIEFKPAKVVCDILRDIDGDLLNNVTDIINIFLMLLSALGMFGFLIWGVLAWQAYGVLHTISIERAYAAMIVFALAQAVLFFAMLTMFPPVF